MALDFIIVALVYAALAFMMVVSLITRWYPLLLLAGSGFMLFGIMLDQIVVDRETVLESEFTRPAVNASSTNHYSWTSGTDWSVAWSGQSFVGEEVTASSALVGDTFNEMTVHLSKAGSPTGTYYVGVWSSSVTPTSGNYIALAGSGNAASLTTTGTDYSFTFDGHTLASGEVVGVFFSGGSSGNWIKVTIDTAGAFDGTNTRQTQYAGSWTDNTPWDLRMVLTQDVAAAEALHTYSYREVEYTEDFPPEFRVVSGLGGVLMIFAAAILFMRGD